VSEKAAAAVAGRAPATGSRRAEPAGSRRRRSHPVDEDGARVVVARLVTPDRAESGRHECIFYFSHGPLVCSSSVLAGV
jgi:hypothetical protein